MASYTPPDPPYFTDINFNPSFYATITGTFITATQVAAKYLNKITGGTITGLIRLLYSSTDTYQLEIKNTNSVAASSILINNDTGGRSLNIGEFGTNNLTAAYLTGKAYIASTENLSIISGNSFTNPSIQILANRNVGLGITNPTALLHLHNPTASGETRISFSDTSSGTTITDGFAIIKEASEDVAIWNYENNAIRFGTNNLERLRIVNDGNIAIGTSDPGTYRLRIRGSANNTFLRIETPNNLAFEVSGIEFGIPAFTSSGTAKITSTSGISDVNNLQFYTSSGLNATSVKMTILGNGNIGMGTDNPQTQLHLHKAGNSQDIQIKLTDSSTGIGSTDGVFIQKTSLQDMFLGTLENARLYAFTNNAVRLAIQANGYTCIVDGNNQDVVNNIFQVGDGGKLRISNGINDYTLIGTKNGDDGNNTKIVLSGSSRTGGNIGCIDHYAITSSGNHKFYVNANLNFSIENTFIYLRKTPRTVDCHYENGGVAIGYSSRVNVGGTTLVGYFIPVQSYTNSIMMCSFTHDSTYYTYFGGHVVVNSTNQIISITNISASNLTVETFIEQTSLYYYIRVVPQVSYNTAVNLRAKIYG